MKLLLTMVSMVGLSMNKPAAVVLPSGLHGLITSINVPRKAVIRKWKFNGMTVELQSEAMEI